MYWDHIPALANLTLWIFEFELPVVETADHNFLRIDLSATGHYQFFRSVAVGSQHDMAIVAWFESIIQKVILLSPNARSTMMIFKRFFNGFSLYEQAKLPGFHSLPKARVFKYATAVLGARTYFAYNTTRAFCHA